MACTSCYRKKTISHSQQTDMTITKDTLTFRFSFWVDGRANELWMTVSSSSSSSSSYESLRVLSTQARFLDELGSCSDLLLFDIVVSFKSLEFVRKE